LVFFRSPEEPAQCALEIHAASKSHPHLQLRMGVHSGPVNQISDVNDRSNVAGTGINVAQRVMDCGDAGHILLSKHVVDDLAQYRHWQPYLHDLGEWEVKHGLRLNLVNLYKDGLGNPAIPDKQNAYFADGVQDEILTDLAKVADLKVISRTSVMQYKAGAQRNLRAIAKALGVSHVVEGSVQRSGGRVRVSTQLIDARTDMHL